LNEIAPPGQLNRYVASRSYVMKNLRTLTGLVVALALLYLVAGSISLYTYRSMLHSFAYYGVSDDVQFSIPEIAQTRARLLNGSIQFLIAGVLVISVAIALLRRVRWSRGVWLCLVTLLVVLHVVRLFFDFRHSSFIAVERVVELLLVVALAVFSWLSLTRSNVIAQFHGNAAAT
jgi:hypothetical protein